MDFQNIVRSAGKVKKAQANRLVAERQEEAARAEMKVAVGAFFEDAPKGTTIQNRALAQMCDMTPSAMASLLYNRSSNAPYETDCERITTRYAEIDESGDLIPGGAVTTKRRYLVTYTSK